MTLAKSWPVWLASGMTHCRRHCIYRLANWLHGIFHFHLKAICSTSWCHHFLVMMLPFPSFKQILAIDLWLLTLNCARFYFPNHLQSDNNLLFCPKCHQKKKKNRLLIMLFNVHSQSLSSSGCWHHWEVEGIFKKSSENYFWLYQPYLFPARHSDHLIWPSQDGLIS